MNKHSIIISVAFCITLMSCSNVSEKQAADDICNCTQQLEQKLSPATVNLFLECENAQNTSECMAEKILNMDSAQAQIFITQDLPFIMSLDSADNEFTNCVKAIEKKYENKYSFDKEETIREVMVEMEKNDCRFGLSLLKQGLKDSIQ
jgi:hypothetical protein